MVELAHGGRILVLLTDPLLTKKGHINFVVALPRFQLHDHLVKQKKARYSGLWEFRKVSSFLFRYANNSARLASTCISCWLCLQVVLLHVNDYSVPDD
jgi:hypothetical protein